MPIEEELRIRKDMKTSKNFLFIRYSAVEGECLPLEVKPDGLPIMQYQINYNPIQNSIQSIIHRDTRSHVRFIDQNQKEDQGYVNGSIIEIWTQVDPSDQALETLNIVHIHVNDTSDMVTFDVAYMHDNE